MIAEVQAGPRPQNSLEVVVIGHQCEATAVWAKPERPLGKSRYGFVVGAPRGWEEVAVQLSRLLDAHQIIIRDCRALARRASLVGDDGTNDLVVRQVMRSNELQVWFLSKHLVEVPLVDVEEDNRENRMKSPSTQPSPEQRSVS